MQTKPLDYGFPPFIHFIGLLIHFLNEGLEPLKYLASKKSSRVFGLPELWDFNKLLGRSDIIQPLEEMVRPSDWVAKDLKNQHLKIIPG